MLIGNASAYLSTIRKRFAARGCETAISSDLVKGLFSPLSLHKTTVWMRDMTSPGPPHEQTMDASDATPLKSCARRACAGRDGIWSKWQAK